MATDIAIWLSGDCEHTDFAAAVDWLHGHCACVDRESSPAAIVVLQSRPGSVSRRHVASLHRLAPLARLILLSGVWCDGELRSGQPMPGVARIRWHQWRERLAQELDLPYRLPRSASDSDRLEQSLRHLTPGMFSGGSVMICTDRRESYHVLADACRVLGLSPAWNADEAAGSRHVLAERLLVDGWRNDPPELDAAGKTRRVLLLDFPRPEDERLAAQKGFAAVVARPLLLPDLVAALRQSGVALHRASARVA